MRSAKLLEDLEFHDSGAYAQPLYVDEHSRVLRFTLKSGQSIREHEAPHSPFYVVVLRGRGIFVGGDGREQQAGPDSLLIFDPGETHSVRALDEELVFVGFLHGVAGARIGRIGGDIGRAAGNGGGVADAVE